MISVDHVTKTYGPLTAVDDVTFTALPGRITGILGPNGAGKSTTLRVLVGLTPPDRGTAHVLGRRFRDLPNPGMEVGVLLDRRPQRGRGRATPAGLLPGDAATPRPRTRALLGDPAVLILDEPANGLDPAGIRWMRDLLRGYADRGATVGDAPCWAQRP